MRTSPILDDIKDVRVTTPDVGHTLSYDGAKWVNVPLVTPPSALDDLTDVVVTTPTNAEVLTYNGTSWVNAPATVPPPDALNDLTDVTITTPANTEVLTYTGTEWVNAPIPVPPNTLNDLTDVTITTPTNTQVLAYNGTAWVNTAVNSGTIAWVSATERLYGPTAMPSANSVAYGNNALLNSATGARNTAVGHEALMASVVGNDNTIIGYRAGKALNSSYNTAVGRDALLVNNSNYRNTSLGCASMFANTSGGYNTAVGTYALYSNISGSYNTAVGDSAGGTSPGSSNVFVGYQAGYSEAGSNKLYIANTGTSTPLIYGDFGTSTLTVNGRLKATTSYITPATLGIFSGGVDVNALSSNNFKLTATANFILYNPTNLVEGMVLNFEFIQDATGGRTITYGTMYKFAIDSDKSLSTAANARDFMSCYYNGTNLLCTLGKRFQ
jgi:hypothetical protein